MWCTHRASRSGGPGEALLGPGGESPPAAIQVRGRARRARGCQASVVTPECAAPSRVRMMGSQLGGTRGALFTPPQKKDTLYREQAEGLAVFSCCNSELSAASTALS